MPRRLDRVHAVADVLKRGMLPLEPFTTRRTKWTLRCMACGREKVTTYDSLMQSLSACGYCSGLLVDPRRAAWNMRDAGLEPIGPYPGANEPWPAACMKCGNVVTWRYGHVIKAADSPCRVCNPKEQLKEVRRRSEADALQALHSAGFEHMAPYPGSMTEPWPMIHRACGELLMDVPLRRVVMVANVCVVCASRSFRGQAAYLYLIYNLELDCVKVGTQLLNSPRVANWQQAGWHLWRMWSFRDGVDAQNTEKDVLAHWRDVLALPYGCTPRQLRGRGGYTETAPFGGMTISEHERIVSTFIDPSLLLPLDRLRFQIEGV